MKLRAALLIILTSVSGSVLAIVFGGTNLGFIGYPNQSCTKPLKPLNPYSFNNRGEIDLYNRQVDFYNIQRQSYIGCVKEYLENAGNDIKRIQEKMDEAIAEAKRSS
jgi:hypothetical protein